jgi:hypothetical protein
MLAAIRTADGTAVDLPGDATNGLDVDVTRLPALAAGTNNIGRVDVASLPALPTGTNAIGRVDVGSALPAGTNELGGVNQTKVAGTAVDVNAGRASAGTQRVILASDQAAVPITDNGGSITVDGSVSLAAAIPAGTNNVGRVDVASLPALAAGTNAIGKLAANSGVDIGDVDVLSVPADPFGANVDAAVAAGAAGSIQAKLRRATQGLEDLKSLVVLAAGSNEIGGVNQTKVAGTAVDVNSGNKSAGTQRFVIATDQPQLTNAFKVDGSAVTQPVGLVPQTSGGWSVSRLLAANTTNATSVKRAAGQVGGWYVFNAATSTRYLKLYDTASTPTAGSGTPLLTIPIPAGSAANVKFTQGLAFASGIGFTLTTGVADADTGVLSTNDVVLNLLYK